MAKKAKAAIAANVKENPKTSIGGLAVVGAAIASLWLPPEMQSKVQASLAILSGSGLIFGATDPAKK
jgi:hypothetical protein